MKYIEPVTIGIISSNIPLPVATVIPVPYSSTTQYTAGDRVYVTYAQLTPTGTLVTYWTFESTTTQTGVFPYTTTGGLPVPVTGWTYITSSAVSPEGAYSPEAGSTIEWQPAYNYDASVNPESLLYVAVSVAYDGNPPTNLIYFNTMIGLNTGNYPPLHPDKWQPVGVINRLKPFDSAINTKCEHLDTITYSLSASGASAIALFGIEGTDVNITVTDNTTSTIIYTQNFDLQANVDNWYDYFFAGISYRESMLATFPVYNDQTIDIVITATSGTLARVGAIVTGKTVDTGVTLMGATLSSVDLSSTAVNTHGVEYLVEGTFLKQNSYDVVINTSEFDTITRRLLGLKNKLRVFIGSEDYESMVTYGFLRRFESTLKGPLKSRCFIDVESVL